MSTTNDRDRTIERLLAGQRDEVRRSTNSTRTSARPELISSAPPELISSARPEPVEGRGPSPCLDAEILAAYADGGLSVEERAATEQHAAGCARCQAVLASIADSAPAGGAAHDASSRWRVVSWLVPLSAAAAALAIWIALPQRAPIESNREVVDAPAAQPSAVAVAGQEGQQRAAAAHKPDAPAGALHDSVAQDKEKKAIVGGDDARARGTLAELRKDTADQSRARSEVDALVARERGGAAGAGGAAAPASPPASFAAPPEARANARLGAPAPAPQATPGRDTLARPVEAVGLSRSMVAEVVSPDGVGRLRFTRDTPARIIDRSVDGGGTWVPQPLGSEASLIAGASPSRDVAWVIGRGGVVLKSSDGKSWQRVAFPLAIDLTAISAQDAMNAAITAADGRRFETKDGGATWVQK